MKKILKNTCTFLAVFIFVIFPLFTFAQGAQTPGATQGTQPIAINIKNPFNCGGAADCTAVTFVVAVLNNIVMPIAAVLATLYIIYSGFLYVTAQGNPKLIEEAHRNLLWALIGTGVLLGAAGISKVVQSTVQSLL